MEFEDYSWNQRLFGAHGNRDYLCKELGNFALTAW